MAGPHRLVPNYLPLPVAVDCTDLDLWVRGVPYREFAWLRHEPPVARFNEPAPASGFWSVHGYSDRPAVDLALSFPLLTCGKSVNEPLGSIDSTTERLSYDECRQGA
jgi:hypothetical protein